MEKNVDITTVKKEILAAIEKRFGTTKSFAETDFAKSLGTNFRQYLYPSGPVNFLLLKKLYTYFGIGDLSRKVVVTRTLTYSVSSKSAEKSKKRSKEIIDKPLGI